MKLPGDLTLEEAHAIAEELEAAICAAVPEISGVQTHLEPLARGARGARGRGRRRGGRRARRRRRRPASRRAQLRFLRTDDGLVAFLTLALEGTSRLDEAHSRASEIEERIRRERPDIADVIVHTEP